MNPNSLSRNEIAGQLKPLFKGALTSSHIVRWCAAQQNWDKIHYDLAYAREVAKLPGTLINGALKQHLIVQFLEQSFPEARVWRVDYRFAAMDFVGEALEVRGGITGVREVGGRRFIAVELVIHNLDQKRDTTAGWAVVIDGSYLDPTKVLDDEAHAPPEWRLDLGVCKEDPAAPMCARQKLSQRLEHVESEYAIDLSRLRLFAEAVGDLSPRYFDPTSIAAKVCGGVLAPPLFPLHALEALPGGHPLSTEHTAMGREGVNEVGRHMAGHVGIEIGWNGGNKVQIHSQARAGDRVVADSTLVGAYRRVGRVGGPMYFFETLNRYATATGRPLVTERQTMICRAKEDQGEI